MKGLDLDLWLLPSSLPSSLCWGFMSPTGLFWSTVALLVGDCVASVGGLLVPNPAAATVGQRAVCVPPRWPSASPALQPKPSLLGFSGPCRSTIME